MANLPEHATPVVDPTTARLMRLRKLSRFLDEAITIPVLNYRIGFDPILGLIPGGGDTLGMVLSAFILLEAGRMGASKSTLGQMAFNILLETVAGTIPGVGDVFDVAWKSNKRNMKLLEDHFQFAPPSNPRSRNNRGFALLLVIGLFLVFAVCLIIAVAILRWLVLWIAQVSA